MVGKEQKMSHLLRTEANKSSTRRKVLHGNYSLSRVTAVLSVVSRQVVISVYSILHENTFGKVKIYKVTVRVAEWSFFGL